MPPETAIMNKTNPKQINSLARTLKVMVAGFSRTPAHAGGRCCHV
jgi:hypothetical protein